MPGGLSPNVLVNMESLNSYNYGSALKLNLELMQHQNPLELIDSSLEIQTAFPNDCKMMVNGFQSWSRSEEMGSNDRHIPLFPLAKPLVADYGDSAIYNFKGGYGNFHSWSYTYFRFLDDQVFFIGSLDEKSGYTVFEYEYNSDKLIIRKECLGASALTGHSLYNLYFGFGDLNTLMNEYANSFDSTRSIAKKISGWCSWYNYHNNITEDIIRTNLNELAESNLPISCFQVDDGWQKVTGDWLEANIKFSSGMKQICREIKASGFRPGLWLAPMVCVPSSDICKNHPDWLLRDSRGTPVKAGYNPSWSGFFYALDYYAPGVQDYLSSVFERVQNEWGYSMLKLDFLYAAALVPGYGKSRGEIMTEVIDFIDRETADSATLGCGVPLGPAFGRFDYCRIGSDVGSYWDDYLKYINYPERVSAENSLTSTIGRRHLDCKMFRNDPDVFMLRDGVRGLNENRLNDHQRQTLLLLNNLLGGLLFFSDQLSQLTSLQQRQLRTSYPLLEPEVTGQDSYNQLYHFEFRIEEKNYIVYANLSGKKRTVKLPDGLWFNRDLFLVKAGTNIELEPHQSICLHHSNPYAGREAYLLGASGHVFPGAQVSKIISVFEGLIIKLHKHASPDTVVYLAVPEGYSKYKVNDDYHDVLNYEGVNYVAISAAARQEVKK